MSVAYRAGFAALRAAAARLGTVNLSPSIAQRDEWGYAWGDFMRGWIAARKSYNDNPGTKRPAQVPAKVWDNYRRIFGGSITPDAAKLIAREYRKKVTNVAKKRTTAKRRNPGSNPGKSLSLRNFTGKIRLNPDKTVSVLGVGRKKKAAKKTATRRKR